MALPQTDSSKTAITLQVPAIEPEERWMAGARFRMIEERYRRIKRTDIFHAVYLPADWTPQRRYPVIVEYPGNRYTGPGMNGRTLHLSGLADSARMGFYLAGEPGSQVSGRGAIWIVMPLIASDPSCPDDPARHTPATCWWGAGENNHSTAALNDRTGQRLAADYLKRVLPEVCRRSSGDPNRVVLAGFSRGAIAGGWIGRADDRSAALFRGFILHSHHDASGLPLSPDDPDGARSGRAVGRPSFLTAGSADSGRASTEAGAEVLRAAGAEVELRILNGIPHTDEWLTDEAWARPEFQEARDAARRFLQRITKERKGDDT